MKIQNINLQPTFGFTLIELLVVATLIGIIGTITTQVFILGFRSQAKSEILKEVKQNGDYALAVVEGMLRNAIDIPNPQCNSSSKQLSIVNPDGYTTIFDCNSGSQIASISALLVVPTPTGIPLTSSKVTISNCNFRIVCPTPPLSPKYVFVNFTASFAGTGLTPTPGSISILEYQTTVSLRKYQ